MLITKFNKMIANKFLWGFFAIIVSVVFIAGFSQLRGCEQKPTGPAAGQLYGKDVSIDTFQKARRYELGLRETANLSAEEENTLRDRTWKRIITMMIADKLTITATDREVGIAISKDQYFTENGVFNKNRYDAMITSMLKTRNVDKAESIFEDFEKQELTISKMISILQSEVWTAPYEVEERLNYFTDSFTVEYTTLKNDDISKDVVVSEDEIKDLYKNNGEEFTEPEKISVRYISIPIDPSSITTNQSDSEIEEYYNDNSSMFEVASTNDESDLPPLAEIRDQVVAKLVRKKATIKAKNAANAFVSELYKKQYAKPLSMEEAAEKYGLNIQTSKYFSADDEVPGLAVNNNFNTTAFSLDKDDPNGYFSDPIAGSNNVYVIAVNDKIEPTVPPLNKVRQEVKQAAKAQKIESVLEEKIFDIHDHLEKKMMSGASFNNAVVDLGMNVTTTKQFTVMDSQQEDMPYSDVIASCLLYTAKGSITSPLKTKDGYLIAYIADQQEGDAVSKQMIRPRLLRSLDSYRARILYDDWATSMMAKAKFKSHQEPVSETDDL